MSIPKIDPETDSGEREGKLTSSMKRTPGINSAIPWSMYELTTLLISARNLSVTSVLRPLTSCPMTLMMSCPPCGRAFAMSRSCSVTS